MKAGKFNGPKSGPRREDGDRPFKKAPYKRAEGGEGDARPPFKKKPFAPRNDAAPRAEGDKPAFAKKPFKPKTPFKGGKPGAYVSKKPRAG